MTDLNPEWYLTFDNEDIHPITGQPMGGHHIILNGDHETARLEACRRFGNQWAALLPRGDVDDAGGPDTEPLPDQLWGGAHSEAHLLELIHGQQNRYNGRR